MRSSAKALFFSCKKIKFLRTKEKDFAICNISDEDCVSHGKNAGGILDKSI